MAPSSTASTTRSCARTAPAACSTSWATGSSARQPPPDPGGRLRPALTRQGDTSGRQCGMATFVLIPGAGGDSWEWHLLIRELEARGQEAIAVTLPAGDESAGWDEYADAVVEAMGDWREDLVLVAQSLGGFTAPLVAERVPVRMIVL